MQEKLRKTTEETSGCVRAERTKKVAQILIATWWCWRYIYQQLVWLRSICYVYYSYKRNVSYQMTINVKVKPSRYTPWRRLGERKYRSYSFTTSALDGGEWSASRPGRALPPGKGPRVPIGEEAGWAPEPVWTQRIEEQSFRLCRGSNLDRPVVQPVVRHYTAWTNPAPPNDNSLNKMYQNEVKKARKDIRHIRKISIQ
jgi:hypothetical protein